MDMKRINLAIQKSGRLNKDSLDLLRKCGIKIDNYKDQLMRYFQKNFNGKTPKYLYHLKYPQMKKQWLQ